MADLEERARTFLKTVPQEDELYSGGGHSPECGGGDTFAERAEWFFKKRPELLNLLKELYNGYISLKQNNPQRRHSSPLASPFDHQQQQEEQEIDTNWDLESSLSNQTPDFDNESGFSKYLDRTCVKTLFRTGSWINNSSSFPSSRTGLDEFVSEFVIKNVEEGILKAQMGEMEKQFQECWRKTEIMKKLTEVLESERVILLSENSRLEYKVGELMEENKGLVAEVMFFKMKGAELSRCVMNLREDQRVGVLTRRIEDLQTQINGFLEDQKKERSYSKGGCFQTERLMKFKKKRKEEISSAQLKIRGRKWWDKFRKGINFTGSGVHESSISAVGRSVIPMAGKK